MATQTILVTGAAGNLGSHLVRHLAERTGHSVRAMIHRKELNAETASLPNVKSVRCDLANPETLDAACDGADSIVHFAGLLFAPRPEKFLPETNVTYVKNLLAAAKKAGVRTFILVSFPHVEGVSTPDNPARGGMDGAPDSAHARTRLEAEKAVFAAGRESGMRCIALRAGMIYARDILMIDAARWLARRHLLGVWRRPTWIHLLSLPDFNRCVQAAIENASASGVYGLGDDRPLTLQEFLDSACEHWGCSRPWRAPGGLFPLAGTLVEGWALLTGSRAPLTRDFIRIGMASYCSDTARMKRDLVPVLEHPTLETGLRLL
jgi:nucleoside-diphosphate-sugar epimerase